jgi:hypothetical protein
VKNISEEVVFDMQREKVIDIFISDFSDKLVALDPLVPLDVVLCVLVEAIAILAKRNDYSLEYILSNTTNIIKEHYKGK